MLVCLQTGVDIKPDLWPSSQNQIPDWLAQLANHPLLIAEEELQLGQQSRLGISRPIKLWSCIMSVWWP